MAVYLFCVVVAFFFFNDTATTEIYTLSLHDALPISDRARKLDIACYVWAIKGGGRSEEHTSELQSRGLISYAVFCLKKKKHKDNFLYRHQPIICIDSQRLAVLT